MSQFPNSREVVAIQDNESVTKILNHVDPTTIQCPICSKWIKAKRLIMMQVNTQRFKGCVDCTKEELSHQDSMFLDVKEMIIDALKKAEAKRDS